MSAIETRALEIDGLIELRPRRWFDERGFFAEVWRDSWLADAGIATAFVQDNHSFSKTRGVLRGLHFQVPPEGQAKLVRVAHGAIFDVAVDLRTGSPTFGKWAGLILSASEWNQLFIPEGFAHGFLTLEDECEVLYKVSAPYSPEFERTIRFDDPQLGIDWPVGDSTLVVSDKDCAAPVLADVVTGF